MNSRNPALLVITYVVVIMLVVISYVAGSVFATEPITEIQFTDTNCPKCGAPLAFELEVREEDDYANGFSI